MKPGKMDSIITSNNISQLSQATDFSLEELWKSVTGISDSIDNVSKEIEYLKDELNIHRNDYKSHVTKEETSVWDSKETPSGAQTKVNVLKSLLLQHENDIDTHVTKKEKELFADKYTKAEINNLIISADKGELPFPREIQYATQDKDGIITKEDKRKLDSIESDANNYIHPNDSDTRHVSDKQIESWNNKADNSLVSYSSNGLMESLDKKKLDSIEPNANNYIHPVAHSFNMIDTDNEHQFTSQDEKDLWTSKETPEAAQEKANKALEQAKTYVNNLIANLANTHEDLLKTLLQIKEALKDNDMGVAILNTLSTKADLSHLLAHIEDEDIHISKELINLIKEFLHSPQSDWNDTNIDSRRYIKNKPLSLPANGGNADTVGGYNVDALMSNKRSNTITIGTRTSNCLSTSVDYLCDGTNDTEVIQKAFNSLREGGKITFREGIYFIKSTILVDSKKNIIIEGNGTILHSSVVKDITLDLNMEYSIIKDLIFISDDYPVKSYPFISIKGYNNSVTNCSFRNNTAVMIKNGSYNRISNNTIIDAYEGVVINSDNSNSVYNTINNNLIIGCITGVLLRSTTWAIINCFVRDNEINNCKIGIKVSSLSKNATKTNKNRIINNTIFKDSGEASSYTTDEENILIEYSSYTIVCQNIMTYKDVKNYATKTICKNNTII